MPGLPVFSSVLFLFTDNPDTVMLIVNSLHIVLLYLFALILLYELKLPGYLKVAFLLFLIFFEPFRYIFSFYWTEVLFIVFTLLAVLLAVKLLNEDNKKYWILGCITVALSAFVKMYGVFNCAFFIVPFILHRKKFSSLIIFILLSSVFVVIWYIRNEMTYGYFTASHKIFQQFFSSNIKRPLNYTLSILGNDKIANVWAIVLVIFSLSPLMLNLKNRINSNLDFKIWSMLLIGMIVNFLVIYILSLITSFDYLESRLLAPIYILALLVFIMSMKILFEANHPYAEKVKYVFLALPFLFFAVNPAFTKTIEWEINIHHPVEHTLWNEINTKDFAKNSSHYITDFNYIHQIYGNKPQRIIPQDFMFLNIEFMNSITKKGKTPFCCFKK